MRACLNIFLLSILEYNLIDKKDACSVPDTSLSYYRKERLFTTQNFLSFVNSITPYMAFKNLSMHCVASAKLGKI